VRKSRAALICLSIGLAIAFVQAALLFGVPAWAAWLTDQGVKANDLSNAAKFAIDLSDLLHSYWPIAIVLPLVLIIAGLILALRNRSASAVHYSR